MEILSANLDHIVKSGRTLVRPDPTTAEFSHNAPSTLVAGCLSIRRLLVAAVVCFAVYLFTFSRFSRYWQYVDSFGDNSPYVAIASAIEHWNFSQLHVKLFWGLPYAVAAVSTLTRLPNVSALVAISIVASLITTVFSYELWGGWVGMAFLILSREWLERSLLGGAEPLFLALLFGGFVAARREKWGIAALLTSLATVVRPMGIFGLAGIGIALLLRRDFRKVGVATAIGIVVGLLYILPLKLYVGDSLANFKGYNHADWNSSSPVTFPFVAIIHNAFKGGATKLNLARTAMWIVFIVVAAIMGFGSGRVREYAKEYPAEATFWGLYLIFLFTYNSDWARSEFPRFAIPLVPFSAFALKRWIPKNYSLLLIVVVLAAALSAIETLGFVHVVSLLRSTM